MSPIEYTGLFVLIVASTFCVDFAHARWSQAVVERVRPHLAARWSVIQWSATTVGFVLAIKVSMWLLPAEALGLYLGSWRAARRARTDSGKPVYRPGIT